MKITKLNFWSIVKSGWPTMTLMLIISFFISPPTQLHNKKNFLAFFVLFSIYFLPMLLIILEYIFHDFGKKIYIDRKSNYLKYVKFNEVRTYLLTDIKRSYIYLAKDMGYYGSIFGLLHFFHISFKNGDEIFVTSFSATDLDVQLRCKDHRTEVFCPSIFIFKTLRNQKEKETFASAPEIKSENMQNSFANVMSTLSDHELLKTLEHRKKYLGEAIEAAIAELQKRGHIFSEDDLLQYKEEVKLRKKMRS